MAASHRHVDDRGGAGKLRASGQHAADPQIFLIVKTEYHAREEGLRRNKRVHEPPNLWIDVEFLLGLAAMWRRLRRGPRTPLWDIRIGCGTSSARTWRVCRV